MRRDASTPLRRVLLVCALALGTGCAMPVGELAERPWTEVVTPHFHLLSDAPAPETLQLAQQLARFRQLLVALEILQDAEPGAPLKLISVTDKYVYDWLMNRHVIAAQDGVSTVPVRLITINEWYTSGYRRNRPLIAGWYVDSLRGSYAVANTALVHRGREIAQGSLFSAFAHFAIARHARARQPLWYEDGFAEYLSGFEIDSVGGVTFGSPYEYRMRELKSLLREEWALFFESLQDDDVWWYPSYFQPLSWTTVHYMLSVPERRTQLAEYVRLYDAHGDLRNAYYRAFEMPIGDLRKEAYVYYRDNQYRTHYLGPEKLGPAPSLESRPVAPSDLLQHLGDMAANGTRNVFSFNPTTAYIEGDSSAERLFERSLERDPANPLSLAGLAALRLRAGKLDEAEGLVRRAEAHAPDAEAVQTTRGNLFLARAYRGEGTERATRLEAARAAYRRALELQPSMPEPYFRMAQTYLLEDPVSTAAIEWLQAAVDLSPRQPQVVLELAALKLARGESQGVEALLNKVLDFEGDRGLRDRARELEGELRHLERES